MIVYRFSKIFRVKIFSFVVFYFEMCYFAGTVSAIEDAQIFAEGTMRRNNSISNKTLMREYL